MRKLLFVFAALLFAASAARAADLRVSGAWIRFIAPGIPAAGYFTLHNESGNTAVLTGARSPAFGHVMLHESVEKGGMSKMRPVASIRVPPHGSLRFAPGGYHLMLMQPTHDLKPGDEVPVQLLFGDGSSVRMQFEVRSATGQPAPEDMGMEHGGMEHGS